MLNISKHTEGTALMNAITLAIREKDLTIAQVQQIAETAAARMDDEGDDVLAAALLELELQMPEDDFIQYIGRFE